VSKKGKKKKAAYTSKHAFIRLQFIYFYIKVVLESCVYL